jgi:acyl carrier protein
MAVLDEVIGVLTEVLQLGGSGKNLSASSHLLGAIPEFDSMAVVSVLTALEEQYGFFVDDDEIDASIFETVDTLVKFVEQKLGG